MGEFRLIYDGIKSNIYLDQSEAEASMAIKMLKDPDPSPQLLAYLKNEFHITQDLNIEGVRKAIREGTFEERPAVFFEYIAGDTLKQSFVRKRNPFKENLQICLEVSRILEQVHERGVIHRDLSSNNILTYTSTKGKKAKLIDFAFAIRLNGEEQAHAIPEGLQGTLAYISPEQTGRIKRQVDFRSDLYSLGVTFYEVMTGQLPFTQQDAAELVHAHLAQTPQELYELDEEIPLVISRIILRLLAKNPDDRYQTARGLAADLGQAMSYLDEEGDIPLFELGSQDVSSELNLSPLLYGREEEMHRLRRAYQRVAKGNSELSLLKGYPGIGKSTLANEIRKEVEAQYGYFVRGSFEQMEGNPPYMATNQALGEFVKMLLRESSSSLEQWKQRILSTVGDNGKLLIDVIPDLELIIGQQPDVEEVGPAEAQNRLRYTFFNFFKTLSDKQHPLVIFIDNCQWADRDSIALLQLLISDPDNQHLWVITTLRDNELPEDHPMLAMVEELKEMESKVDILELSNLDTLAVNKLVADTLKCSESRCQPLSDAIYGKTQGNPFFVRQMLMSLHEGRSLWYSNQANHWEWDLNAVQQLNISDNVVELMASKIQRLTRSSQEILKLASCVGNRFSLLTLQALVEVSPEKLLSELNKCISEGLIADLTDLDQEKPEDLTYGFTHDRIRQAVYSLIPSEETPKLHLRIGRILLAQYPKGTDDPGLDEHIFDVTGQWNQAYALIENKEDRRILARLNLAAGRKANGSAAYKTALEHLSKGMELLAPYGWENNYTINHGLANEAVEAAYLDGDYELLENLASKLIRQSVNLVDKVKAYELSIKALISQNKFNLATERGLTFLAQLGVTFPTKVNRFNLAWDYYKTRFLLRNKTNRDLVNLPVLTDPLKVTTMRILSVIAPAIFLSQPELMPFLTFEGVRFTVTYGLSPLSAESFVSYGNILTTLSEDLNKSFEYGELAMRIQNKFGSEEYKARTYFSFYASLAPLKKSLRSCLPPLLEGYQSGLNSGDMGSAGFCISYYIFLSFLSGVPLEEVEKRIDRYQKEINRIIQGLPLTSMSLGLQVIQNLRVPSEKPYILQGNAFEEEKEIKRLEEADDQATLFSVYYFKMYLAFLFEAYDEALRYSEQAAASLQQTTQYNFSQYPFIETLLWLAVYPNVSRRKQRKLMEKIEERLDFLSMMAEHAPANNLHKYYLMEAERLRVLGEDKEARDLYEKAIQLAREHEYLQEEALAWELAGRFYRELGHRFLAETYLLKAWQTYKRYGAEAKTHFLERRYPHFIGRTLRRGSSVSSSTRSTSSGEGLQALDLDTINKASIALSGEVVLSNLVEKMMQIVIENAGAERGVFVENRDGALLVVADGQAQQGIRVRPGKPLEESDALAASIANFVARTQKPLVLSNASDHESFGKDTYIAVKQPKSILCYPISYKGNLSGLIYLENNLNEGVFTPERIEILRVLSAQIAISIENARLYENLDEKVRRRTEELNRKNKQLGTTLAKLKSTQSQLVQSEKMASLGQLTAGIAHEINNPINFVSGNIGPLARDIEDIKELLIKIKELENTTNVREGLAKVKAYREEIDADYLFEEIEMLLKGIRDGAIRTKNIVAGLKTFSRLDEDSFKMADVHEGIDSTLTLLNNKIKKGVTIHKDYGTLPRIECLPGKLNQVLMNILNNALDALEGEGEIYIKTWQEGELMKISITDTGVGMEDSVQARIFEPFYTTKDVGEGTGLGLSISYGLIQQHNGTIEVASEASKGSTFTLTLPLRQEE